MKRGAVTSREALRDLIGGAGVRSHIYFRVNAAENGGEFVWRARSFRRLFSVVCVHECYVIYIMAPFVLSFK